jgi:PLP dependent protein
MTRAQQIADGLARVRERIARAELTAGRAPGAVRLVAVSKKMTADDVRAAMAAGQRTFGENYGQELRDKRSAVAGDPQPPEWHFIGPLQSNKVKYVAGQVTLVHTIDSVALLEAFEARGVAQTCLVQVNVAGEPQKRGVAPDAVPALLDRFATAVHIRCAGFMLIPPFAEDPAAGRPHFAALRALRDREAVVARANVELRELSMGMSGDFEHAIAEGATLVRVGTAIFGTRASP